MNMRATRLGATLRASSGGSSVLRRRLAAAAQAPPALPSGMRGCRLYTARLTVAIIAPAIISRLPEARLLALTKPARAVKRCVLLPSQAYSV